ncbi:MAG: HmuY family protein [Bacteroidetes bacterium]|nr:HmuY family protein [Bacteroidota bacterium]
MRNLFILISASLFLLSSCERPEPLVPPLQFPAGLQTKVFGLGENYENQIWFEFSSQQMIMNRHDNWDIAFSCDESHRILVNGGKNANFGVKRFIGRDFNYVFTPAELKNTTWDFDNPSGEEDSLVFSKWCSYSGNQMYGKDYLYLFDLGDDTLGAKRYVKLKILERTGGVYTFKWCFVDDTVAIYEEFKRIDETRNYIYYNFGSQSEVYNEPLEKTKWDIVFTTYKKWIPNESNGNLPYPYVLRGVLSNANGVMASEVTGKVNFDDITLSYAKTLTLNPDFDEIGYDWKVWSMTANKYTVDQNKIYVIRDTKGDYYKLKFVDFYDDLGRKGYPKMAWEALK